MRAMLLGIYVVLNLSLVCRAQTTEQIRLQRQFVAGHTATITSLAVSPNGKLLASGDETGTMKLWDIATRREVASLPGHSGRVTSFVFSSDGKTLVSTSWDKTVKVWDVIASRERTTLTDHTREVNCAEFSHDGKILATAGADGTLRLWDATKLESIATHDFGPLPNVSYRLTINGIAFSPDDKTVVMACLDGSVKLWDVASREILWSLSVDRAMPTAVAFSPDGKTIVVGTFFSGLRLVDVASQTITRTLREVTFQVGSLLFSPDGRWLASACGHSVELWDVATWKRHAVYHKDDYSIEAVCFSRDSRWVFASWEGIVAWDIATGNDVARLSESRPTAPARESIRSLDFNSSGDELVSARGSSVEIWSMKSGLRSQVWKLPRGSAQSVAFHPNGQQLAIGSSEGTLHLRSRSGDSQSELIGHKAWVGSVRFSPDGRMMASGSLDGTVRLWDVEKASPLATLRGESDAVRQIAFSEDGAWLAAATLDGTIDIWNVASRQRHRTLNGHAGPVLCVVFGEGTTLFSGGFDKSVKQWNTETGECVATLTEHRRPVWSLAFDLSQKRLASGDGNGLLVIWNVAKRSRHRAATLDDNPTNENSDKLPLSAIAYLPNGQSIACVLENESIALLQIPK